MLRITPDQVYESFGTQLPQSRQKCARGSHLDQRLRVLFGLCALLGMVFACGLPGWVMVRGFFAYAEYRKGGKNFIQMVGDLIPVAKAALLK